MNKPSSDPAMVMKLQIEASILEKKAQELRKEAARINGEWSRYHQSLTPRQVTDAMALSIMSAHRSAVERGILHWI